MPKKFSTLLAVIVQKGRCVAIMPVCDVCGKPIVDFQRANIVFESPSRARSGAAYPVHWECDSRPPKTGWLPLSSVFKSDQRGSRDRALMVERAEVESIENIVGEWNAAKTRRNDELEQ